MMKKKKMKTKAAGPARGRKQRISRTEMAAKEGQIIADIRGGSLSYREIAQKHGVSLPTVNNKAKKAGISRGRRKGARIVVPGPRRGGRRPAAAAAAAVTSAAPKRRGRPPKARAGTGFVSAFRTLVIQHHPNMTVQNFERLMRLVEDAVS